MNKLKKRKKIMKKIELDKKSMKNITKQNDTKAKRFLKNRKSDPLKTHFTSNPGAQRETTRAASGYFYLFISIWKKKNKDCEEKKQS